jgi:hypothetical protein
LSIDYNNDKKPDNNKRSENIFEIMDGIIDQLNNTKRLFIAMILTVMIIPPLVFIIAFELINSTSDDNNPSPPSSVASINHHKGEHSSSSSSRGDGLFGYKPLFTITRNIPLIIGIIWLGVGIRQWIVLSKWSKRYQRYKELQKKIDEEMNNEEDS